ncbi:phage integrase SAM-like domain-containing protein [Bacillus sp. REN3]|uniref:tyrosine-type recombinase/integrase n=1 Tax=Bacillus sp. REN3 TaxID=2802440 RepID=UPI001FEF03F7|nr:phage integrase SAM-like domain-containing protein [Bacillus sp. REN3]
MLKFAVQDFLDDREFKNVTPNTLESYRLMIGQLHDFLTENEVVNVEDVTPNHIKKFILHYQKKGNNATTTNSKLQRIRAFFNYMLECEVITNNPAKKIQKAKEDIKIDVFTDYHIKQMLNYYRRIKQREKAFYAYRHHSIIVILIGTGIRLSEMTALEWSDVDFLNHNLSVFGKIENVKLCQ